MLKIWGRRNSFNVQKVLWLMGELGLAHEHISAGGSYGLLDEPAFRALNPHGRVPVLQDGDLSVWESHAILRYLAAQYSQGAFWPDEPAMRSHIDRWRTGRKPLFNRRSSTECSGVTTGPRKHGATARRSARATISAPSCSSGSTLS